MINSNEEVNKSWEKVEFFRVIENWINKRGISKDKIHTSKINNNQFPLSNFPPHNTSHDQEDWHKSKKMLFMEGLKVRHKFSD